MLKGFPLRWPGRLVATACTIACMIACASPAPPISGSGGTGPGADAGSDSATAAPKALLSFQVKDRAVVFGWPEDEFLWHCLALTQLRTDRSKPVTMTACGNSSGQPTITFGDLGAPGVDYGWTATEDFRVGPATWALRGGYKQYEEKTDVGTGTLEIGTHFNGPCQGKDATSLGLAERHETGPVTVDATIKVGVAARANAEVITPEIWVDSVPLQGSVAAGGTSKLKYTFDTPGMYVVEVNDVGGGAILNCAVYVGPAVPLVAVEVAGGGGLAADPTPQQLAALRKKLLDLTNLERAKVTPPLGPLALHDKLNEVAQYHSGNMAAEGFFAHTDKKGMGPGERAKLFGWSAGIGENIASNPSAEGAHNGLYWSAGHRANMLGKDWTLVGFGIAKQKNGANLLVTENFSSAK
ncbi:MAG: CAP domain-containing protein [Myxococcales bacterium]|nr:CAP domain-containing protein [Myxococcales bacterium]